MIPLILQIVAVVASAAVVCRAEPALNRMSRETPAALRLAFVLLAVAAVWQGGLVLLAGAVPCVPGVLVTAGVALLLHCDRRARPHHCLPPGDLPS